MFKTKLAKVAYAISVAEGWFAANTQENAGAPSLSYVNHNPGNLKASPFQIAKNGEFAVFENDMMGYMAILWQLWEYTQDDSGRAVQNPTLYNWLCLYNGTEIGSPEAEHYMEVVEQIAGVTRNDTIKSILE